MPNVLWEWIIVKFLGNFMISTTKSEEGGGEGLSLPLPLISP